MLKYLLEMLLSTSVEFAYYKSVAAVYNMLFFFVILYFYDSIKFFPRVGDFHFFKNPQKAHKYSLF